MATDKPSKSIDLVVGSRVAMMQKNSGDRIFGTVLFIDTETSRFGLTNVKIARKYEEARHVEGIYQLNRKNFQLLAIAAQVPKNGSPNQDDKK